MGVTGELEKARGLLASGDIPGLLWHLRAHGEALPLGEVARLVAGAARFAGFDDLAQAGVLAVDAVDGEHRVRLRCELAPGPLQRGLQLFDHRSLRSLGQRRRQRVPAAERAPGSRADHTVGSQVTVALELLDRALGHRAEDAIDLVVGQGPAAQAVRRTRLRRP